MERIRASLARSPFYFLDTPHPLPEGDADAYVADAEAAMELLSRRGAGVPVIACGPASLMRSAFLCGCADYLRDPWQPEELGLRALAALQRVQRRFEFAWGAVSLQGAVLSTPAGEVMLTVHEARILRALLMDRGSPVPRPALACLLWGKPGPAASRAMDVHVASIRRKIRAVLPKAGPFIRAVRREGYVIP